MLKRLLLTVSFLALFTAVLVLPVVLSARHRLELPESVATGLAIGTPVQMASRVVLLLLLAIGAYWIAGRLVRAT